MGCIVIRTRLRAQISRRKHSNNSSRDQHRGAVHGATPCTPSLLSAFSRSEHFLCLVGPCRWLCPWSPCLETAMVASFFLKSLRPFRGTWWRAWARPTSSTMAGSTRSPTLLRRSSYSGHASWVPVPQMWKSGLKDYDASHRRRRSGLRRLRGVSRSAAVRSLLTSCPKGGETARPRGRSSGSTCSDVPPPPPLDGRRWPGGRGKKKATRGAAAGRADRDKREREKAVAKLVDLLDFLDLPIAVRARQYHKKTVHLRRGARGLRVSTLRMPIRAWTKLQTWLEARVGSSWPHSVDDVLGYQRREKCRGIAAGSPGRALSWRPLGRCAPRIGQLPARARDFGGPGDPVMVLFALELVVLDTARPLYVRGFAWVKLLKLWALFALR